MNFLKKWRRRKADTTPISIPASMTEPAIALSLPRLAIGAATDLGRVRSENEDSVFTLVSVAHHQSGYVPLALGILADGMGGYEYGGEASRLAVRRVAEALLRDLYLPILTAHEQRPINQVMTEVVGSAHFAVQGLSRGEVVGTTLTMALVIGTTAYLAHVGDSRAYRVAANGRLTQITHDHTVVGRLVEMNQLSPDEARVHPQRHILYRSLGQPGMIEVDLGREALTVGEGILICSDGLWESLGPEEMSAVLAQHEDANILCQRLVNLANQAGGEDNITALFIRLEAMPQQSPTLNRQKQGQDDE